MKYLLGLLVLFGCSTVSTVYLSNPLIKKQLAPMKGYKTLTNVSQKEDGSLLIEEYDLNDVQIRKTLKELAFRCNVGGKMYFICEGGPGLCRREDDTVTGFWPFLSHHENFAAAIDVNDRYLFLIDAKTRCESERLEKVN